MVGGSCDERGEETRSKVPCGVKSRATSGATVCVMSGVIGFHILLEAFPFALLSPSCHPHRHSLSYSTFHLLSFLLDICDCSACAVLSSSLLLAFHSTEYILASLTPVSSTNSCCATFMDSTQPLESVRLSSTPSEVRFLWPCRNCPDVSCSPTRHL